MFKKQLSQIQKGLRYSTRKTDTVIQLVKQVFELPFNWLERKILETDAHFEAYHQQDIEDPRLKTFGSYKSFSIYLDQFEDELPELFTDPKKQTLIINQVTDTLSPLFDTMELQVFEKPLDSSKGRIEDEKVRQTILSMTLPQRVLYIEMMRDFSLQGLTTNLDGGRCHDTDFISALGLPYEKCTGTCLSNKNGEKDYHFETWMHGNKVHLCMQANPYFDNSSTFTSGIEDDCTMIIQAFHRQHIPTLPEKRIKQLIHFLRVVATEEPESRWIFKLNGQLTKLTSENWS